MLEGISCPKLEVLNATVKGQSTTYGSEVVVECNTGYRINGLLQQIVTCEADGLWKPEVTACLRSTTAEYSSMIKSYPP